MNGEQFEVVIIGGGQAGLAMSAHLTRRGVGHVVLERGRIVERWRSERWDSLVANGPAWHDRFPEQVFADVAPEAFAPRDRIVAYFEDYARDFAGNIRCGVNVSSVTPVAAGFAIETSQGPIAARQVVVATGPFQVPVIPDTIPVTPLLKQIHSTAYRNPRSLPDGGVLVIGAGSSGAQIAEELRRAGRQVWLSVGEHERPPCRYRGKDFVWWLNVLGEWDKPRPKDGAAHVTIAVSGARGGHTIDFRRFAREGMTIVGRTAGCTEGVVRFAGDLRDNLAQGDVKYLAMLNAADAYAERMGLDLPPEPQARQIEADAPCIAEPIHTLDLRAQGITTVIWATGFRADFSWIAADAFDARGMPRHERGVCEVEKLYFLGLSWLSRRASAFIWGVWPDAEHLAGVIASRLEVA